MSTPTLADIFDRPLPRFAPLDLATELALIEAAQSGSEAAKLQLLHQYAAGLRRLAATEYTRAGGTVDAEETRANVLLAFMEALAECDGTTRVAAKLRKAALKTADAFHLVGAFAVPERTRQRYFQAVREAGVGGDAEARAAELGMSHEVYLAVRDAFRTDSIDGITAEHAAAHHGADYLSAPVQSAEGVTSPRDIHASTEDHLTVARAFSAVDDLTRGIIEDGYGFAFYDDGSTPTAPIRDIDPYAGFDPIPDVQIAHLRGMSRTTVQRKRTEGLAAMRVAVGA